MGVRARMRAQTKILCVAWSLARGCGRWKLAFATFSASERTAERFRRSKIQELFTAHPLIAYPLSHRFVFPPLPLHSAPYSSSFLSFFLLSFSLARDEGLSAKPLRGLTFVGLPLRRFKNPAGLVGAGSSARVK